VAVVTEPSLLGAWESALALSRRQRALVLAGLVSEPGGPELADLPVGAIDLMLLRLREQCFGPLMDCLVVCPDCGEELDAAVHVDELRFPPGEADRREISLDGTPLVVRAVTTRDLLLTGDRPSLLRRCVAGGVVTDEALPVVENVLDQLDPQAAPTIELDCPNCRCSWAAPFDVAEFVWLEVDRTARRTLGDVHVLALAYGWRESDVLALTPVRRGYYLQAAAT
jgi:hypothetical protein